MIKNLSIGQYVPGDSFVHKLDPRVKLILSIIFMINIFIVKSFIAYGLIALFIIFLIYSSKLSIKYIYRGIKPIFVLIIFTAAINIFLNQGEDLIFKWKFITIYKEGVYTAIFMILRLVILISSTTILTLTTSPIELTDAIEYILGPFKKIGLPAHEIAMMMTIALRFIPTLMDETDKIMKAQMARGADFESKNLVKKAKSFIPILVPLFVSSFRRADELAMAMESRCYKGGKGRTRMKILKVSKYDYIAIVVYVVFFAICFAI